MSAMSIATSSTGSSSSRLSGAWACACLRALVLYRCQASHTTHQQPTTHSNPIPTTLATESDQKLDRFVFVWEAAGAGADGAQEALGRRLGETDTGPDTGLGDGPRKWEGLLDADTEEEGCSEGLLIG